MYKFLDIYLEGKVVLEHTMKAHGERRYGSIHY